MTRQPLEHRAAPGRGRRRATAGTLCGLAALGALLLAAPEARAYDAYAHQAVAGIALRHLTPAARAAVDELIEPYDFYDFNISSWPDFIRGSAEYEARYPNNQAWHFVDFDAAAPYREGVPFVLQDPAPDNLAVAIPRVQRILANPRNSREQRFDALRFLVHFLGEVHQPFHCISRDNDLGGNNIPVRSFQGRHVRITAWQARSKKNKRLCLHSVWDDEMFEEYRHGRQVHATVLSLDARIPRRLARSWLAGSARDWAIESYWVARRYGYSYADGTPLPSYWGSDDIDLTAENYIDSRLPFLQTLLQKAGIRLAHLLNLSLDPGYTAAKFPLPDPFENPAPSPWAARAKTAAESAGPATPAPPVAP